MATVVAETSLKIKSFAKIFAIIFFIYNFRLKKITNLITGKIEIYIYYKITLKNGCGFEIFSIKILFIERIEK